MKLKDYLRVTPDSYLNIKVMDKEGNSWKAEKHDWHRLEVPEELMESEITLMVPFFNEISVLIEKTHKGQVNTVLA